MTLGEELQLVREELEALNARVADASAELQKLRRMRNAKASRFESLQKRIAMSPLKPCADCGTPIWPKSTRCHSCEDRRRGQARREIA